jgi:hypothetical protein
VSRFTDPDDIRYEAKHLLIDLIAAGYSRDELIEIVDEAIEWVEEEPLREAGL